MRNKHIGSSFDDFLREEGLLEETRLGARKIGLAIELRKIMKRQRVTEAELARRLRTTRGAVRRILDPTRPEPKLGLLERVAVALGCTLDVKVLPASRKGTKPALRLNESSSLVGGVVAKTASYEMERRRRRPNYRARVYSRPI